MSRSFGQKTPTLLGILKKGLPKSCVKFKKKKKRWSPFQADELHKVAHYLWADAAPGQGLVTRTLRLDFTSLALLARCPCAGHSPANHTGLPSPLEGS